MATDFDILKSVVLTRESIRAFNNDPLEKGVLETILGYSLRTPTSMNLQPYRIIIVRDVEKKELLASCMSEKNHPKVENAGASLIICSDMESDHCVEDFGKFAYQDDWKEKCSRVSMYATLKYYRNTIWNFCFGWILDVVNCIQRLFGPSTYRISMQAWTNQQAAFLMMNILLLAQSKGISGLVMNGYDEEKILQSFHIPKRFHVSGVLSLGYKPEGYIYHRHPRFPFDEMIYNGYWKKQFNLNNPIIMRGGKKGSRKGRERVLVENEDDIIARNMMEREEKRRNRREEEEEESEEQQNSNNSSDANESDEEPVMRRPARRVAPGRVEDSDEDEPIFETANLNRGVKKAPVSADGKLKVELSGRQKRELEQEKVRQAYFQRTLEGKTDQAKSDLERLAKIRAQREEAARRRKEEEEAKAAMEARIKEQARLKNKK